MTQETFLRAWQYVAINPVEKMKSFLYRVATNLIVDYKRKKKERSLDVLAEAGFEPAVEEKDFGTDFIEIENVKKKIDRLEEPYREAILMRYIDELSPKEIAALTGESVNVVSVRITRAKEKLKKALLTE
jgi:RNA polymerase sigma-70 factor (ECF subfamily)